jgi:hypothetical protein
MGMLQKIAAATGKSADEIKKLLNYGSQKAPVVIDDLAEEAGPIANRVASEVDEVAPEVIGKATPRVKPEIEIPEAELVAPKVSSLDAAKEFAKKNPGKIIGGLTLAEMARQMMGGDQEPPMMTPPPQAKGMPAGTPKADEKIEQAIKQTEIKSIPELSDTDKARAAMDKFMANIPEDVKPAGPSAEELYAERLAGAQTADSNQTFMNTLLRAANQAGSAIAMVKPDYSGVEALEKGTGRNAANFKEHMATRGEAQKLTKVSDEMNDDKALRDPNSKISQETKTQLAKYGINVKTAMEAKQLNPQIFNLLLADRAQQNQKAIAALNKENKDTKTEKDLNDKQRKFARDLRKEATTGVLGKQYATFSTGQRMEQGLTEFAKNPSGYKDYGTLMGGLKTLQGDESVVREAEVRLGMNATSAINKALNHLQSLSNGKQLQPSQRAEMIDTIKIMNDASRKQYLDSVAPILEQADQEGVPHSMILSKTFAESKPAESTTSQYSTKEEAGIENFAKAKGISREEAITKLKAGGRLK